MAETVRPFKSGYSFRFLRKTSNEIREELRTIVAREAKCKYCGARILWVRDIRNGRSIPINSGFTPFKFRRDGNTGAPGLFTNEGVFIPCEELPEEREAEAEGYAHRGHVCPAGSRRPTERPMSRAEKFRENQ